MAISSSIVIADAEKCRGDGGLELNSFGLAENLLQFLKTLVLLREMMIYLRGYSWLKALSLLVVVSHGLYCLFSGLYIDGF